jgi:S1-C subfamily serine protease
LSQEQHSFLAGDDTQGLLGAEVFRRYRLTLNFRSKQAIFTETPETQTPYEHDMSGMFLIARGDDFRTIQVINIVDGGPAAKAGIKQGDTLIEIDGKPSAKLTLEQLRAEFKAPGATRVLTVQRGSERLTVTLLLQRLV